MRKVFVGDFVMCSGKGRLKACNGCVHASKHQCQNGCGRNCSILGSTLSRCIAIEDMKNRKQRRRHLQKKINAKTVSPQTNVVSVTLVSDVHAASPVDKQHQTAITKAIGTSKPTGDTI